jgi:hypothetical protein
MRRLALALPLAIALAGCGSTKARLKPAVFTSDATKACRAAQASSRDLPRPAQPGDVPVFLRRAARVLRSSVNRLEALRPPTELDAAWRRQTGRLNRQLAIVVSLAHHVKDGRGDAVKAVLRFDRQLRSGRAAIDAGWRELGLPGCLSG